LAEMTALLEWKNKLLLAEMAERRQMEERLQGAEDIRRIFEKMATPVIMMEENKVISLVNAEFEKLSGYSKEEVEGKKCLMDFFGEKDSERVAESLATQDENPDTVIRDNQCQLLDKTGDFRAISLTVSIIPETKKSIASLINITETKKTEERFKELEEIYVSIMQNVNEGIALIQDGVLKFGNPKISDILGYSKEELTSKPFREFILPEDWDRFEIQPDEPTSSNSKHTSTIRVVQKDGAVRWVDHREILIHWRKNKGVLYFLTDKTHRKLAEEELRISMEPFRNLIDNLENYFSL
jgi:PAS domain S-box-containing protein